MDDLENYYEKQKEVLTLKEKLRYLKYQERMKNLHEQLQKLTQIKKELVATVSTFNENCKFVSENIENIHPLLVTDSKINMKQECAEEFKAIVGMMPLLLNCKDNSQHLHLSNLNIDTEKIVEDTSNRIHAAKMNLYYSSMLDTNVKKLTNSEAVPQDSANPHIVVTETDRQSTVANSNDSMNCTTDSAITFSAAVSSSPLHEHFNPK